MSVGSPGSQRGFSQTGASRFASALLGTGHGLGGRSWLNQEKERAHARGDLAYRVPERELPLTHPAEAGAQ